MRQGVDLFVAGARRLLEVVDAGLQRVERGVGFAGDPHLHRLAGVLGLHDDRAQFAQLLLDGLQALVVRIVLPLGQARAGGGGQGRAEGQDQQGSFDHVSVIPSPDVEITAQHP